MGRPIGSFPTTLHRRQPTCSRTSTPRKRVLISTRGLSDAGGRVQAEFMTVGIETGDGDGVLRSRGRMSIAGWARFHGVNGSDLFTDVLTDSSCGGCMDGCPAEELPVCCLTPREGKRGWIVVSVSSGRGDQGVCSDDALPAITRHRSPSCAIVRRQGPGRSAACRGPCPR